MEVLFVWLFFAVIVGVVAGQRGRTGFGWFLLANILSPLLAGVLLLVLRNNSKAADTPDPQTHVRCPDCRELVRNDARKCKHCGAALIPIQEQTPKVERTNWN
jgi:hypothetical protein